MRRENLCIREKKKALIKKRVQKSDIIRLQFPIKVDPKPLYDKNVKLKKKVAILSVAMLCNSGLVTQRSRQHKRRVSVPLNYRAFLTAFLVVI